MGDLVSGVVRKIDRFGCFVGLDQLWRTSGLLHISNVAPGQRVDTVEQVLNKGDEIAVRVVEQPVYDAWVKALRAGAIGDANETLPPLKGMTRR